MKNKIIIFICAFALVFSLLVVPSFAFEVGDEFTFVANPTFTVHFENYFDFYCDGAFYSGIHVAYQSGTAGAFYEMSYYSLVDDSFVLVYVGSTSEPSGYWTDEVYRTITILYEPYDVNGLEFMEINEYGQSGDNGWYYDMRDLLISTIFYDGEVPPEAEFGLSLISLILCVGAILLPVLMVFGIFLWILKRM